MHYKEGDKLIERAQDRLKISLWYLGFLTSKNKIMLRLREKDRKKEVEDYMKSKHGFAVDWEN